MFRRLLIAGTIAAAFLAPQERVVASGQLEVRAASQSVHFRIVIPEVNPLRLKGSRSAQVDRELRELRSRGGDSAARLVVEDRLGRHHMRQVSLSADRARMTLATP